MEEDEMKDKCEELGGDWEEDNKSCVVNLEGRDAKEYLMENEEDISELAELQKEDLENE